MSSKLPWRREYSFIVSKVFSPSDRLGLEILSLMAAYNDMGRIVDWMKAEWVKVAKDVPANPIDRAIYEGLICMQIRMTMGFLHEAYEAVERMVRIDDFNKLEELLDDTGRQAFKELLEEKTNGSISKMLEYIRNKAAFHYIAPKLGEAIKTFQNEFGKDFESSFIYEGTPPTVKAYYLLADDLRNAIAFGIKPSEPKKLLDETLKIQLNLYRFLESAHKAHIKLRGTQNEFKPVI